MDIRALPAMGSQISEKIGTFTAPNQAAEVSAARSVDLTGAAALPESGRIEAAQREGESGASHRPGQFVDFRA